MRVIDFQSCILCLVRSVICSQMKALLVECVQVSPSLWGFENKVSLVECVQVSPSLVGFQRKTLIGGWFQASPSISAYENKIVKWECV